MSRGKLFGILTVVGLIFVVALGTRLVEEVGPDEVVVIQYPITGTLKVYNTPGAKLQWFGTVTTYPKSFLWEFDPTSPAGYAGLTTRFNDAAEGEIRGSLQIHLPQDRDNVLRMHETYHNANGVRSGLIKPVVNKCVLVVGTLMNSQESLAEKRTEIISWTEDMANFGIYRTRSTESIEPDLLTGEDKIVTKFAIVINEDTGLLERVEDSKISQYGVSVDNMSISDIEYGEKVLAQIDRRRQAQMEIETAIAEAKTAEQRALTVEQDGIANAATAKWEQEVIKAQQETEAEQKLSVAILDRKTAEQEKAADILRGEGIAERKRLVMEADGALELRAQTYLAQQEIAWAAIAQYQGAWQPGIVMGGGQSGGGVAAGGGAQGLMEVLTASSLKQLGLDLGMPPENSNK